MAAGQIRAPMIIPLRDPQCYRSKVMTSNTKIEIISESGDTDIFFTINGMKPEIIKKFDEHTYKYTTQFYLPPGKRTVKAIAVSKCGNRESNVVTKVFQVEESAEQPRETVTDDTYGFLEELKKPQKMEDAFNMKSKSNPSAKRNKYIIKKSVKPPSKLNIFNVQRKTNRVLHSDQIIGHFDGELGASKDHYHEHNGKLMLHDSSSTAPNFTKTSNNDFNSSMKLHREVDFLKCSYCLTPRSLDSKAKFCLSCGQALLPLPGTSTRLPPPESGQLGVCVHCHSTVPMNVHNCLVCEAPLELQNQPQASMNMRQHIMCSECGTTNPPNLESCLTCESPLLEKGKAIVIKENSMGPPVPLQNSIGNLGDAVMKKCFNCSRQNHLCARFCDWCGSKQFDYVTHNHTTAPSATFLTCWKCHATNSMEAGFCCQCGEKMAPPMRDNKSAFSRMNGSMSHDTMVYTRPSNLAPQVMNGYLTNNQNNNSMNNGSGYIHVPLNKTEYILEKPRMHDRETQTVGLFYPSTAKLRSVEQNQGAGGSARDAQNTGRNHYHSNETKPASLSLVSPGKGFWRKQVDHIIAHLKAHASNNAEFQALIGEPRMGKLISANIHEEEYEMNLVLNFSLKGYKDPYLREISENFEKKYLSSMLKRTGSIDSFRSDNTVRSNAYHHQTNGNTRNHTTVKKRSSARPSSAKAIQDPTKDLLREIGKGGEGKESRINELIEQGADYKSKSKKGTPVVNIAIRNKHFEGAVLLIKNGASINDTDSELGNTAFHELVLLGNYYNEKIPVLLELGANPNIKNNKGESALDIAEKSKNQTAVNMIVTKMANSDVKNIIKPRQIDTGDL